MPSSKAGSVHFSASYNLQDPAGEQSYNIPHFGMDILQSSNFKVRNENRHIKISMYLEIF